MDDSYSQIFASGYFSHSQFASFWALISSPGQRKNYWKCHRLNSTKTSCAFTNVNVKSLIFLFFLIFSSHYVFVYLPRIALLLKVLGVTVKIGHRHRCLTGSPFQTSTRKCFHGISFGRNISMLTLTKYLSYCCGHDRHSTAHTKRYPPWSVDNVTGN